MDIYLKSFTLLFLGIFLLSSALFNLTEAQSQPRVPELEAVSEFEANATQVRGERQTGQTTQRGIFQPRENRLVLQLDDLTEEQLERIDELNREHREKVLELRAKLRNREIAREAFLEERRTHYENHQQELKQVLTKAQWEQLKELRAERRRSPSE